MLRAPMVCSTIDCVASSVYQGITTNALRWPAILSRFPSSEAARCHVTREQKEVRICHTCHSSLNMPPKKNAKKKGATKKSTSPDVSESLPLSESGDVSNHETRQMSRGGC